MIWSKNKFADQKKSILILISIFGIGIFILNLFLFCEYYFAVNEGFKFASNLAYTLNIIFSITVIYLIYFISINRFFKSDKGYEAIISNLSTEIDMLEKDIKTHKNKIQSKMEQIIFLEQKISRIAVNKPSINLDNFNTTPMELNVIRELSLQPNLSNYELASILGLKTGTVKQHMNKVFKKLDISSRQELVERCSLNFIK